MTLIPTYPPQLYPKNIPVIQSQGQSIPGLFAEEAGGRITPIGNFTDFLDSIEYFYGLAPILQASPASLGIFEADVVAFSSECPEVASSVVYLRVGPVSNVTGGLLSGAGAEVTILKQVSGSIRSDNSVARCPRQQCFSP